MDFKAKIVETLMMRFFVKLWFCFPNLRLHFSTLDLDIGSFECLLYVWHSAYSIFCLKFLSPFNYFSFSFVTAHASRSDQFISKYQSTLRKHYRLPFQVAYLYSNTMTTQFVTLGVGIYSQVIILFHVVFPPCVW